MAIKGIFYADPVTHEFTHSDIVEDDYQLQANETFENPTGKLEPAKLAADGTWTDATQEEHAAWVKQQEEELQRMFPDNEPVGPSKGEQALNALGLQIAQVQKTQAAQSQAINALGLQLAAAQKNATTEK